MVNIASSIPSAGEEWLDADFDLPEGEPISTCDVESEKEDEEDWDLEMDLGKTGGAKIPVGIGNIKSRGAAIHTALLGQVPGLHTIRPPLQTCEISEEDEDEGVSTIKGVVLPQMPAPPSLSSSSSCANIDEDFEEGFALPTELTRLSLRPLQLNHRASKSSMEWGDKDHTTSSQSSDAYSTLGFADHSPSSTVYTSASLPDTEEEDECESDDLLDGLIVPSGLFESGQSVKKLARLLETKKKTVFTDVRVKVASPDPEDDFESGLLLDDDVELSPSRLVQNSQPAKHLSSSSAIRSKSVPPQSSTLCPPSRVKTDRAKSPHHPPVSSVNQFRKLNAPPSPPRTASATHSQTYSQALASAPIPSSSNSLLTSKVGGLRGQKSHSGLKPLSPPPSRQLSRKASLPSLSDKKQVQSSGCGTPLNNPGSGYNAPTASSRAKTHGSSTSRLHTLDFNVPPTRPTTPSSNPNALRLTMPTSSSRLRNRTPISAVFGVNPPPLPTSTSPVPTTSRPSSTSSNRPSSSKSRHAQSQSLPGLSAAKVLKRPKRQRTYGDGTELDGFEDLPLDRDKEGRYRVQPKGHGNRVPGASYVLPPKDVAHPEQGLPRRLTRSGSTIGSGSGSGSKAMPPPAKTLKRASRMEFPPVQGVDTESATKRKKLPSSPTAGQTRRKPTLIRNLGGFGSTRVVGEMKWNPQTLRWEGNDQVLRDFDATVGTSTRPALITHLTGSSMGSPVNSFATGARKVGNMMFDPSRMCWISMLPPEEEEPDVFANLADDEDSDDWDSKGDTIRAQQLNKAPAAVVTQPVALGPSCSRTRSRSESESDRCSRGSMVCDVDEGFLELCRAAEQRHRQEMRGWATPQTSRQPDRSFLHEIRALATRQY